jgi:aminopeptidase N
MIRRAALLVLCALIPVAAFAQRLPGNVVPEHYDLAVTPDLRAATFSGREVISVKLAKPSTTIVLNAAEIRFDRVTVAAAGRTQEARVTLRPHSEQATLSVAQVIPAGAAELTIVYRGILNDQLRGLYLSKANNRRYAVTQLEATDARRMFPSFDEPAFKATFSLTATIDNGDHAISNGAVVLDTPGPGAGKHTVKFDTTPRMSTYLVALAVGDFECESGTADEVPIRICSTPDKKGQTGFALEAAQEILRYYNRYYAIPYPFKKLDVVAVPDFAAGAMENTAAIFYRETLLLSDPANASVDVRKDIALVLAHEMAHQWFGDLVTMQWWDDIWLNEGFANWMETKPLKAWKPEWHMELDEVQSNQKAMALDSLESTRPIRAKASTPAEINELFDAIAYEKGAAVLRMVEAWVGEDAFRSGVNRYLERFKYSNARAEDFWGTLTSSTKQPVDRVMAGFVDKPAVPLIDAATTCEGARGTARVAQEKEQAASGRATNGASSAALGWSIPVCVKGPAGKTSCEVVGAAAVTVPLDACPAWVMANAGARGYYRVVYPPDMIAAMSRDIAALAPAERITLVADEWALVRAGRHGVGTFLDLASGLRAEREPAVMQTLVEGLRRLDQEFTTDASRTPYRAWVSALLGPALRDIGWSTAAGESADTKALRATLVDGLGNIARDAEVIARAREVVAADLAKADVVDPALLNAVVPVAAHGGSAALYDQYLARSRSASDPEDHYRYLYALASFSDPALVKRTMDLILGPDVRSQDAKIFIARLLGNRDAQRQVWELLRARWDEVQKKTGEFVGNTVIVAALASFCDAGTLAGIRQFFAVHKVPDAQRTLQQAVEQVSTCAAHVDTRSQALAAWLTKVAGRN